MRAASTETHDRRGSSGPAAKAGVRGRDQEVLDAGAEVFARKGYAAATVQDVADALGILKGSLYYYIKTKEDLLFRVMVEVHEAADVLHAEVAASDLSAYEQLLLYVRLQVAWNMRNLVRISVYYNDMRQLSPERLGDVRQRAKAHERFIVDLIAEGQRAGDVVADIDPVLLASHVFAVVIWPYRWFPPGGRASVDDLVAMCVDFVRNGLSAPTTDRRSR
jgi:AcrR family transcriptional regulator